MDRPADKPSHKHVHFAYDVFMPYKVDATAARLLKSKTKIPLPTLIQMAETEKEVLGKFKVRLVTDSPEDLNEIDIYRCSALIWLAKKNYLKAAALLLQRPGLEINHCDRSGETALYCAVNQRQPEMAILLLQQPNINTYTAAWDGRTVLHEAAIWGNFEVFSSLIDRDIPAEEINRKDTRGARNSPLMEAVICGHLALIELFLEKHSDKLDLNAQNINSETVLILACKKLHIEIMYTILAYAKAHDRVINLSLKDRWDKTFDDYLNDTTYNPSPGERLKELEQTKIRPTPAIR